ncbi:MAG: FGGY family carbohydrate kinase, partial [Protaetiibacter sp.]
LRGRQGRRMSPARRVVVGVDLGITSIKVQVLDVDGASLAIAATTTPWRDGSEGRFAEPDELRAAILATVDDALAEAGRVEVVGVGTTGFAESGVLLDVDGVPVAPILPWYDEHGAEVLEEIRADFGERRFAGITGLILNLKPSILKYRWLAERASASPVRWLSAPEWVAFELTGVAASEGSLASRTGMFDVLANRGSKELLAFVGAPAGLIPPVAQPGTSIGRVREEFGALAGAAVTIAGIDHLVAAVGIGATRNDDLVDSCGTGEALIRRLPGDALSRDDVADAVAQEITVGRDVLAGRLQLMASLRSGLGMWRFLKLMRIAPEELEALDEAALALETSAGSPVVDALWTERASLDGIPYEPDHAAVWRAVIESAQRRAAVLKGRLDEVAGPAGRIVATGGGLSSRAVRELKAAALGELVIADVDEAASRGAALLALEAAAP